MVQIREMRRARGMFGAGEKVGMVWPQSTGEHRRPPPQNRAHLGRLTIGDLRHLLTSSDMQMTALAHPPSGPHHLSRIDSWKAIADYFGRSVRTVMRWERDRNLPVHHVPGGSTRTVYALVEELDAWMAGEHGVAVAAEAPVAVAPPLQDSSPRRWHQRHPWLVAALVLTGMAVAEPLWASGISLLSSTNQVL